MEFVDRVYGGFEDRSLLVRRSADSLWSITSVKSTATHFNLAALEINLFSEIWLRRGKPDNGLVLFRPNLTLLNFE